MTITLSMSHMFLQDRRFVGSFIGLFFKVNAYFCFLYIALVTYVLSEMLFV